MFLVSLFPNCLCLKSVENDYYVPQTLLFWPGQWYFEIHLFSFTWSQKKNKTNTTTSICKLICIESKWTPQGRRLEGKALTNCFIRPNMMRSGGITFWGATSGSQLSSLVSPYRELWPLWPVPPVVVRLGVQRKSCLLKCNWKNK